MQNRPQPGDYASYAATYINMVIGNDILSCLQDSKQAGSQLLRSIPLERWDYKYAPGKWTIKELIVHLIDAERVFAHRALRISRGDQTPIPGFDENSYVLESEANQRSVSSIIAEFEAVKEATLALFNNLSLPMWDRRGVASENPVTVLALAYIICGHQNHHFKILEEKYLV